MATKAKNKYHTITLTHRDGTTAHVMVRKLKHLLIPEIAAPFLRLLVEEVKGND